MKFLSIISSTLLAASLGLGINAPAQAHDSKYSLSWFGNDHHHHPRVYHDRHDGKHHKHKNLKKFWRMHNRRHHDDDRHDRHGRYDRYDRHHDGRGRDYDRHDNDRHHADRGRDNDRHDGHDRHRRH